MVSPISWFEQKGQFEKMSENEDEFRAVVSKRTVFLIDIEPSHVQGLGHETVFRETGLKFSSSTQY